MLRHHLKARTIKEDEKESDIVGYGIGSIILIMKKKAFDNLLELLEKQR
jgi:hypothetical protein